MSNKIEQPMLAKNIRELRTEAGLSQAKLGKELGYSQQIINAYESGQRVPPTATLEIIAEYFDTSIDILLGKKKRNKKATPKISKVMEKLKIVEALPKKEQKQVIEYAQLLASAKNK